MESIGNFEYNTRDMLGHGAFAMVYKGRYKKNPEKEVAVKRITKKNLARSQNLLKKEIKILQELTELHHENVVSLLDCKETPQYVYLVMEYCNGGDLMDYLNLMNRTLSEDTIRIFIRQIAAAMKALQAKGIVHRDLKPQNILLCYQSQKDGVLPPPSLICLKIADFGFARFLKDGVMAATLCGSPMYMAPEVIMSLQYDAKADLWSIATIIYQCLTGAAPFKANTPQELKLYYEQSPNLAPLIPKSTSPELTDLLTRLLRRNAKDRMDFDDFFSHPFILSTSISSSPSSSSAASSSTCHSCDRAPSTSPSASSASALQQPQLCSPVASPVGSSALPRPSSITSGGEKYNLRAEAASSRRQHPHARVARIKEEDAANAENIRQQQQQQPSSPRSSQPTAAALGQSRPKSGDVPSSHHHRSVKPGDRYAEGKASAGGSGESSGSSGGSSTGGDTFEDFVMINEDVVSTITATAGGAAVQPSSLPQRIIRQALRPLGNYMPEPLPVPTQRAAYEAIQRSSGSNTSSIGVIQESAGSSSVAMLTSPPATPPSKARFGGSRRAGAGGSQNQPPPQQQPQEPSSSGTMNLKRHDSCSSIGSAGSACSRGSRTNMLLTDVSNMSPPSMNFVLGSSGSPTAAGGIVSSSNIASMNRSRRLSVPMSPGPSISPSSFFNCQSGIPYNTAPCCGHSYGRSPGAEHVVSHGQHQHQQHQHQQQQQSQHPPSPSNPSPLSQMLRHSRTDPSLSSHLTYFLPSSEGALRSHFGSSRTVDQMSAAHQHQQQQQFSGQQYRMSMPSGGGGAAADGGGGNNGRLVHRHHFPNSPAAHPYFQQMQTHVFSCCAPGQHAAVPSGSQIVSPSSPTWSARNFHHPYGGGPSEQQNTITFEPPGELSEETLLDKGHNETLAKLNFVLALVDSIFEYINSISSPMAVLSESIASDMVSEEKIDKVRFVLYLRCLQLLTSALKLSQKEINSGRLWTSNSVRSVVKTMRDKYRKCLDFCKDLNRPNIIKSLDNISADKLLYEYAIKMCQSGAIEEIVGVREESFKRYQTAQILLHSLSQQAINEEDRNLLNQYREAVEKRMFFLQNQGVPILLYNQN